MSQHPSNNMEFSFETPSKVQTSSDLFLTFTPKRSLIKTKSNRESSSVSRLLKLDDSNSHSPLHKSEDFSFLSQQASCDTSSPFTPKRSLIKRISNEKSNIVSRILSFDDDKNFKISLPNTQALHCKDGLGMSEPTTPIKNQQPFIEKNNKILLSPSIKNHPMRFNITPSKKRSYTQTSLLTQSKKAKFSENVNNCKITSYFKPIVKVQDSIVNKLGDNLHSLKHKLNDKNNLDVENSIKSKFSMDNIEIPKLQILNQTQSPQKTNQNLNVKKELQNLQEDGAANDGVVTPKINKYMNTIVLKSPIADVLESRVIISGGDTYSRFIKYIVLNEIICLGKINILEKIDSSTNDELKLYGRFIARKHDWIRHDGLERYEKLNLCGNFYSTLKSLATKQLINTGLL